jgi:hypothetical protein
VPAYFQHTPGAAPPDWGDADLEWEGARTRFRGCTVRREPFLLAPIGAFTA